MNKNNLRAQALAIVMVVLVVVSIIGMAMFSRMATDKRLAVEEQNSAAAAQAAKGILDVLVGADIDVLESTLDTVESFEGIKYYLRNSLNLTDSAEALPDDISWCEGGDSSAGGNTYIKLSTRLATEDEYPEVQPGSYRSYNLEGETFPSGSPCNLYLRFRALEDQAVFAIKFVYAPDSGTQDQFLGYCAFSSGGGTNCGTITNVDPTNSLNFDSRYSWDTDAYKIDPIELFAEYNNGLREIRVLPIKGVIGVNGSVEPAGCTSKQFTPIKVIADATCNGASQVYEMTLPGSGNLGYSTLFDYGIYDTGDFRLKH